MEKKGPRYVMTYIMAQTWITCFVLGILASKYPLSYIILSTLNYTVWFANLLAKHYIGFLLSVTCVYLHSIG